MALVLAAAIPRRMPPLILIPKGKKTLKNTADTVTARVT
jgi:hypothetical protein